MILKTARRVLKIEAEAIANLINKVNDNFIRAVDLIAACKSKVVLTGIGKSGFIAKKIASTLASTGTPAFFLHPAEGIHGDLGMLSPRDVVIVISNSGESDEVIQLLPLLKHMNLKLIVFTGNSDSTLASRGDVIINTGVKEEACPWGCVPTSSTTAALAMGDALAIAVLEKKGVKQEDFAIRHPGGTLGKRLLLKVADLMHIGNAVPLVKETTIIKDTLLEMTSKRLGVTGVVNKNNMLVGVITDGDLRRALEKHNDILNKTALDIMTTRPKLISGDALAVTALEMMEEHSITTLFVYKGNKTTRVAGIIHLHDLLKAGIV